MLAPALTSIPGGLNLRRFLPFILAGMLAAAIMAGWNIAFADGHPAEAQAEQALTDVGNLTTMAAAFLVFFMQAGFAFLGAGPDPGQKHGQLYDQELYGLRHRLPVFLGFRLCP